MELLETDEERQKLLEMEEYEKGTIYFGDFLYAAQHIVRIREGKSSEGPFLTGFPD